MRTFLVTSVLGLSVAAAMTPAHSDDGLVINGSVSGEMRVFLEDPLFSIQEDRTFFPSASAILDMQYSWDNGAAKIELTPFGLLDAYDDNRTHWDLREANFSYRGDGWDMLIGAHTVFWGKVESRHLVNIINQVDFVENLSEDTYLGQPMLNVNFFGDWGKLSLFGMTGFRERKFPGPDSHFGIPGSIDPIDTDGATYESGNEEWNFDFAVRYENSFDGLDFGLSYFHGNSREPQFVPVILPGGGALQPRYQEIDQFGVDASYALGNLLLKAEAIYRITDDQKFCLNFDPGFCLGTPDDFFAISAGAEYTLKDPFDDGSDLGFLVEYNFDDRNQFNPATVFDHDILFGARWTMNDENDSHILAAAVVDYRNNNSYVYLEASRRFGDDIRVSVEARLFNADDIVEDIDPLLIADHEDYLQVKVTKYF